MAGETARGEVMFDAADDFTHDNVTDLNETVVNTGAQDVRNKHGGWWRQVIGGNDADAVLIAGERVFEIDEGEPVIFETRLQVSDVSVASVWVGLTDDPVESIAIPYENEDGVPNTVADDSVGFLLEGEETVSWTAVGAQNTVANTAEILTTGPAGSDGITITLRMELWAHTSGYVEYYINGDLVATKTNWFRSGILFVPAVACDDRGTTYTVDYDYVICRAPRSAT